MMEQDPIRQRLDEAVFRQAEADRKKEIDLAKIASDQAVAVEKVRLELSRSRTRTLRYVLAGVAVLLAILAIVGAIWFGVADSRREQTEQVRLREETAQRCIAEGNIWLADRGCLLVPQDRAPVPAAS